MEQSKQKKRNIGALHERKILQYLVSFHLASVVVVNMAFKGKPELEGGTP